MGPPYDKPDRNLSMSHNYNKNNSNTVSFGGFHDEPETNPSGGIINSYGFLTSNQNTTAQGREQSDLKNSDHPVESNLDAHVDYPLKVDSKTGNVSRIKEPNNFPSNAKSCCQLKNLDGIIKGTGYLCSCGDCNHSKPLNAYEFERHAGAKTEHPNNHIYFENGKTIYAVVQELKNSLQETLFDAFQNVTGSQINQKNFRFWKD